MTEETDYITKDGKLQLPILIIHNTYNDFVDFSNRSGFYDDETKYIRSLRDIQGYKDKILIVRGIVLDQHEILQYAKQHNIRIVNI